METINRIEAILFSSGKKVSLDELKRLCRIKDDKEIVTSIEKLKERYNDTTSLMIVEENNAWKMTVREKYLHFIKKIVTDTEISKTVMETLSVIAWKNPALQADIIKIRTNKAYAHIANLEEAGFIESVKHGRTRLLKLTKKFNEYFDLQGDREIKEAFKNVKIPKIPQTKVTEYENVKKIETFEEPSIEQEKEIEKIQIVNIEKEPEVEIIDIPSNVPEVREQNEISEYDTNSRKEK